MERLRDFFYYLFSDLITTLTMFLWTTFVLVYVIYLCHIILVIYLSNSSYIYVYLLCIKPFCIHIIKKIFLTFVRNQLLMH